MNDNRNQIKTSIIYISVIEINVSTLDLELILGVILLWIMFYEKYLNYL